MQRLSINKKIALAFLLAFLLIVAIAPSESISTFTFFLAIPMFFFVLHLVAQRGARVGFPYRTTFILAWLALPLTAFVVWVVRRPVTPQQE